MSQILDRGTNSFLLFVRLLADPSHAALISAMMGANDCAQLKA